jgi:hypothetical protein
MTGKIAVSRRTLAELARGNPLMVRVLEAIVQSTEAVQSGLAANVEATDALDQATVLTLSPNNAFQNERVLQIGAGLSFTLTDDSFTIASQGPVVSGGFTCTLQTVGNTTVALPLTGQVATTGNTETLRRKTLDKPKLIVRGDYANDAAAAAGGVELGELYRTGTAVQVRVV